VIRAICYCAEVKERVELYLYSPSGHSWLLPLLFFLLYRANQIKLINILTSPFFLPNRRVQEMLPITTSTSPVLSKFQVRLMTKRAQMLQCCTETSHYNKHRSSHGNCQPTTYQTYPTHEHMLPCFPLHAFLVPLENLILITPLTIIVVTALTGHLNSLLGVLK
jgi:hypothetical protein